MIRYFEVTALALLLASGAVLAQDACKYDRQCKGDRICEGGRCVAGAGTSSGSSDGEVEGGTDGADARPQMSTTCRYTSGPKAGRVQYFPPNLPGLRPASVGQPCTDDMGSWGEAIPDKRGGGQRQNE